MAYSEIINEIQEQIDDITALIVANAADIAEKEAEIVELQARVPNYEQQLVGLNQLKANAQSLVDNQHSVDINLNVNVNSNENSNVVVSSGSSIAQDGPFSWIMEDDRLERLRKALKTVEMMNGSPDIIESLKKAIAEAEKEL